MKELSIIIPAYNVENYIKECIDSVLNQNLKDYEIIIVNDGSTDKTAEIIEVYKNIENIKVINQKNMGLSAARNEGLKNAIGKYILFLDSDDFIEKDAISECINYIKEKKLDILAFNYWNYFNEKNIYLEKRLKIEKEIFSGLDYLKFNLSFKSYPMAWLNIYSHEFLYKNKLFFKEGILHEDVEFNVRLLTKVEKMSFLDVPLIYYRHREGSITKKRLRRRESYIEILKTYLKEMDEIEDKELIQLLYNYMFYISKNIILESIRDKDFDFLAENKIFLKNILKRTNKIKYKILKLIFYVFLY